MKQKFFIILIISFLAAGFIGVKETMAGASDNVWGWAWSENIGWISFNSTNCDSNSNGTTDNINYSQCPIGQTSADYGVNINTTNGLFSGYAWSENIGWISFNSSELTGCPSGTCEARTDFINCPGNLCPVSGWARVLSPIGNSNAGGWDGWIKLNGANYGVSINKNTSPYEFNGWAWGGDDNDNEAVVGWISFNRTNCDPDKNGFSNGIGNCPAAGTPISNYKVITGTINSPPAATPLPVSPVDYCDKSCPPIILNWTFSDDPGDTQSAYQIQIDNSGSSFPSPEVDTGKVINSGGSYTPSVCLSFGETYYWRVKVWDNHDLESSPPLPFSSFQTDSKWPSPNFTWTVVGGMLLLILPEKQLSPFIILGPSQLAVIPSNLFRKSPITPAVTITSAGSITLTTTSDGRSCSKTHNISALRRSPEWREIPPF